MHFLRERGEVLRGARLLSTQVGGESVLGHESEAHVHATLGERRAYVSVFEQRVESREKFVDIGE